MINLYQLGQKICIIGCSSTGKSTLAEKLSTKLNVPVYHLDVLAHYSNSNWSRKPDEELVISHHMILKNERWIIDGNYSVCMPERFKNASAII